MRFTAVSCEEWDAAVLFIISDGTCEKINYFFALATGSDRVLMMCVNLV